MLTIKINNINRNDDIDRDSVSYSETLTKEVDTLSFSIKQSGLKSIPVLGDIVEFWKDTTKIFGGVIIEKSEAMLGGRVIGYDIGCKDNSYYLDGKLVVKNYNNLPAHEIFINIINTYSTGFSTNAVKTSSPIVPSISFNYEQVTAALTKLSEQIGWDWYVDADKNLHFFDKETYTAPFVIDDVSGNLDWQSLEINHSMVDLRNSVFVRGGNYKKAISSAGAIDVYKGDGTQGAFTLVYQYDNIVVEKNGVVQTVGINNIGDPSATQVLYDFSQRFIKFSSIPAIGDTIRVYGEAYIPIIAHVRDQASIKAYGEFQEVIIDKSITSVGEAQKRAKQELLLYAQNSYEAKFKTKKDGLRTGQVVTINSPVRGINKAFKINRISAKTVGDELEYTVSLISSGEITFIDIMLSLLGKDKNNIELANNEVLQRLDFFNDNTQFLESININKNSGPYTWDNAKWGYATYS